MIWDTGLQSQYLHFHLRKDAYVSELKVPFSTWQMSYSDICPGFNFMNLFWLLYICFWKDILGDLTFKKMQDDFLNSILQVKKAVSINFICVVWRYFHVYSHKYISYK